MKPNNNFNKVKCICGSYILRDNHNRHLRSIKHLMFKKDEELVPDSDSDSDARDDSGSDNDKKDYLEVLDGELLNMYEKVLDTYKIVKAQKQLNDNISESKKNETVVTIDKTDDKIRFNFTIEIDFKNKL